MFKTKKGQMSPGLIIGLVMGIASLVIAVIIAFIIVSTLTSADLFSENKLSTIARNETVGPVTTTLNTTFGNSTFYKASCAINQVANTSYYPIAAGNYTQVGCQIRFSAPTDVKLYNNTKWIINSTTTYAGNIENTAGDLSFNFTKGVDNVSSKIPTVLLIAAIVLILGVLVLLVGIWQKMRIGGGGI